MEWEDLHNPALGGCSDVSINSSQFASFGEDGSIHVMDIKRKQPLRSMRKYILLLISNHVKIQNCEDGLH